MRRDVDTKDPNLAGTSLARQLGLGVRTVVIDPATAGPGPGTIGKSGPAGEGGQPGRRPGPAEAPQGEGRPGRRPDPGVRRRRRPRGPDGHRQPEAGRPVRLHPRQRPPGPQARRRRDVLPQRQSRPLGHRAGGRGERHLDQEHRRDEDDPQEDRPEQQDPWSRRRLAEKIQKNLVKSLSPSDLALGQGPGRQGRPLLGPHRRRDAVRPGGGLPSQQRPGRGQAPDAEVPPSWPPGASIEGIMEYVHSLGKG
ncbi:MAG: hypothetical protein MZU95_12860 [Desulfomicrobium escambiense]|nr:hypothetical protein [Desulfomicrobium escambiense]